MALTLSGFAPVKDANILDVIAYESAAEKLATSVHMSSDLEDIGQFGLDDIPVVAKGGNIPEGNLGITGVELAARKFAKDLPVYAEDAEDLPGLLDQAMKSWAKSFGRTLDNAVFATNGAGNGGTRPFTSVYQAAGSKVSVAKADFDLGAYVDAIGAVLGSGASDVVVAAHPSFQAALMKANDFKLLDTSGKFGLLDGRQIHFTSALSVSATATAKPTGNPLLVVADKDALILGDAGTQPVYQVREPIYTNNDAHVLRVRARRGFVLVNPASAAVVELTTGA